MVRMSVGEEHTVLAQPLIVPVLAPSLPETVSRDEVLPEDTLRRGDEADIEQVQQTNPWTWLQVLIEESAAPGEGGSRIQAEASLAVRQEDLAAAYLSRRRGR